MGVGGTIPKMGLGKAFIKSEKDIPYIKKYIEQKTQVNIFF